jgi:ADP-ribose pyrophosphatase YjhB (NUDIX family)
MTHQDYPIVRVTGVLVEQGSVLLARQELKERSHWTLPGGQVEFGERLADCLVREMHEETGLDVEVLDLLYLCDRFRSLNRHVIDISFLVKRTGGHLFEESLSDAQRDGQSERLAEIRMVPFSQIEELGLSEKFVQLLKDGLPNRGTYQGEFHRFWDDKD